MKEPVYELVINSEKDEVFAISLVNDPAIERDFVYFSREKENFAMVNEQKKLLCGAIMVPDKKIIRVNDKNEPYYVFFKSETIKQLAHKYIMKSYQNETTLEHSGGIDGVTLVESWIVDNSLKDKSNAYGLTVPTGSWMGVFKVQNDEIWNDYIKTGEVKGFSVEGMFEHQLVSASNIDLMDIELNELNEEQSEIVLEKIIKHFNDTEI